MKKEIYPFFVNCNVFEVQKQVLTVAKKTSAVMEENSGVEASMNEGEMKDYVVPVIEELRSNRVK